MCQALALNREYKCVRAAARVLLQLQVKLKNAQSRNETTSIAEFYYSQEHNTNYHELPLGSYSTQTRFEPVVRCLLVQHLAHRLHLD